MGQDDFRVGTTHASYAPPYMLITIEQNIIKYSKKKLSHKLLYVGFKRFFESSFYKLGAIHKLRQRISRVLEKKKLSVKL